MSIDDCLPQTKENWEEIRKALYEIKIEPWSEEFIGKECIRQWGINSQIGITIEECSTLTGGNRSTLSGGDYSTLTGGHYSTLTGGNCSRLFFHYWDDWRYIGVAANVGVNGIKPNTPYQCDNMGNIVEVTK